MAMLADSFMTSPKLPVRVSLPLPGLRLASINKISPPTDVQAKPVTTPATSFPSYKSLSKIGAPNIFSTSALLRRGSLGSSMAILVATPRTKEPIFFSKPRTPDSRVYSSITFSIMAGFKVISFACIPCCSNCLGRRWRLAISIFSSMV